MIMFVRLLASYGSTKQAHGTQEYCISGHQNCEHRDTHHQSRYPQQMLRRWEVDY